MCIYTKSKNFKISNKEIICYGIRVRNADGEICSLIFRGEKWVMRERKDNSSADYETFGLVCQEGEYVVVDECFGPIIGSELGKYAYGNGLYHFFRRYNDAKRCFNTLTRIYKDIDGYNLLLCEFVIPESTVYIEGKVFMTGAKVKKAIAARSAILYKINHEHVFDRQESQEESQEILISSVGFVDIDEIDEKQN